MKNQLFYLALAGLALFQACQVDEKGFRPDDPSESAYKVQIYGDIQQQPATRVTTDGFCTNDEVGVFIVNYDGETPGTLKLEDNQADNVKFRYSEDGEWVSDYDVYYRDNDTKVDFYGYYPYADPTSVAAYPYEVARDQSKDAEQGQLAPYESSDFLWAKTANVTPTSSKVILTFRHMMSCARVRFAKGSGWDSDEEYAAVSKAVLITNTIRKSTIDLATGTVTPDGEAPLSGIVPMDDNGEYRAIVVPQTVEAGKQVLVITVDGSPRQFVREVATEYLAGKITTFDLSLNKKTATGEYEIELSGVNISAWEADNVSHGDDAREYVVINNAIAGRLEYTIVERLGMDPTKIKNLKLTGSINATDYKYMRDKMTSLLRLNLKEVESKIDGVYCIPNSALSIKTLIKCFLPDRLERIEDYAFSGTSLAGTVILPEGLKYVSGFSSTKITKVSFPSTLEEIGSNAFQSCESLMCEMSFPASLRKIGDLAFQQSAISGNLVFPDKLEYIGQSAFYNCSNLRGSLVIPSQIKEIASEAFCSSGLSGTLTLPRGLEKIGYAAFYATKLKGELIIPDSVTTIGDLAFSGTLFNGNLVFPKDLISLGSGVFSGCWRLSGTVTIPSDIATIPSRLFRNCTSLEGVVLHKDVEVIEAGAFSGCTGITSIVCNAKNPPTINSSSFSGVAKDNFTVEVPDASVALYRNANYWSEFKRFSAHKEFSISRSRFRTLNAAASKDFILRVPASGAWSVESKPDWVEVSPSSGNADAGTALSKVDVSISTTALATGAGNRSGEVVFLLDGADYRVKMTVEQYDYQYGDRDVLTLQTASKGSGVDIVILGDCFDAKDISEGSYLEAMQNAYEYFFDIEPYKTYKDYFNVYAVFGMSPDSGMGAANTVCESRFGSQYEFNEGVSPDFATTFAAASLATGKSDVSRTLVMMVENSTDYAGLTYMFSDGSAVAVIPMSTDPSPYDFRGIVHHEAGGHGFGKLADEYIYHNAFIQSCACICCGHVDEINRMQALGYFANISLSGSMHDVPWSHLIYDSQYSSTVDVYEGAFFHTRGVYRSEPTSCMHNNIAYYNAISREAIVKRIMAYAGESYSFEDFKANDVEALSTTAVRSSDAWTWNGRTSAGSGSYNQLPPRLMETKPDFNLSDF